MTSTLIRFIKQGAGWIVANLSGRGDGLPMAKIGTCERCSHSFPYDLFHSGFSDVTYAYCDCCGATAVMSAWSDRPAGVSLNVGRSISPDIEPLLAKCRCGGRYRSGAEPRCPSCRAVIRAQAATSWIEAPAAGAGQRWRWQQNWTGLYFVIIDEREAKDPWRPNLSPPDT